MTSQHRRQRGHETERAVADYLAANGWPTAEPVGAGRSGSDITGLPAFDIECKSARLFAPLPAMRQLDARAVDGRLGLAVIRPDGFGPASVAIWPVAMPLSTAVRLMHAWETT